jgi:chromosome partitioning protein
MIIVTGQSKGGCGKTTLAVHLAVAGVQAGRKVLLIDGDPQATAADWSKLRDQHPDGLPAPTCVQVQGVSLRAQVKRLAPDYDLTVIDVGGRDTTALRYALSVADVVIAPTQPLSVDLWALDQMLDLCAEARGLAEFRTVVVFNRVPSRGGDLADARTALAENAKVRELGVQVCGAVLVDRLAYNRSLGAGLTVLDPAVKDAARGELVTLLGELNIIH